MSLIQPFSTMDQRIVAWEARLQREWPERKEVTRRLVEQIRQDSGHPPTILELGCGSGYLSEVLVRHLTDLRYVGLDLDEDRIDFARRRVAGLHKGEEDESVLHFWTADLRESEWLSRLERAGLAGSIDTITSLQSLHDLGEIADQEQILSRSATLLSAHGILVYADLLHDSDHPHPRRITADRHIELLQEAGYKNPRHLDTIGPFGIFGATV